MFARLTRFEANKDKTDEVINIYKNSVVPSVKSEKGRKRSSLLIDRNSGKGISISMWETEADAIANEQSGKRQEQVDKFKDLFTAPPVPPCEGYEVSVED